MISNYFLDPISDKETKELFYQYIDTKDKEVKEKIFRHYLRLVAFVMNKMNLNYEFTLLNSDDAYSIGMFGLLKAIDKFDPNYGTTFVTYAYRIISNEIKMALRARPNKQYFHKQLTFNIEDYKETELFELKDPDDSPEEVLLKKELSYLLNENIKKLEQKKQYMINKYYNLEGKLDPITLNQIGIEMNTTIYYVRKIARFYVDEDNLPRDVRNLRYALRAYKKGN